MAQPGSRSLLIGRRAGDRAGLEILFPKGCLGSNPSLGVTFLSSSNSRCLNNILISFAFHPKHTSPRLANAHLPVNRNYVAIIVKEYNGKVILYAEL